MEETAADRLAIAVEQLHHTSDTIHQHGINPDDLSHVAAYLYTLTEQGTQLAALAERAIQTTPPEHPLRGKEHGLDVQAGLGHAGHLLDAAMAFAGEAERALRAINHDDT